MTKEELTIKLANLIIMLNSRTKLNSDLFTKDLQGRFMSRSREEELNQKIKRPLSDKEQEMINKFLKDKNENRG